MKNSIHNSLLNNQLSNSSLRRQSCCCRECGQLTTFQKLHLHLLNQVQEHKKLIKSKAHSNDFSNQESDCSIELIDPNKNKQKQPLLRRQLKLLSLPPFHEEMHYIQRKRRRNSCHCDQCGIQSIFQKRTQNLFVKIQKPVKQFLVSKNRIVHRATKTMIHSIHLNSPMMKYQQYSRTAKLILEQSKLKTEPNIIQIPSRRAKLPTIHTFRNH